MIFRRDHVLDSISQHQETIMLKPTMSAERVVYRGKRCYLVQYEKKENQFDKYEQEYKYALRQRVKWFISFQVHLNSLVIFIL